MPEQKHWLPEKPLSFTVSMFVLSLLIVLIGVAWEFGQLNTFVFSKPSEIAKYVFFNFDEVWLNTHNTTRRIVIALLVATPLGLLCGTLLALYRRFWLVVIPVLGFVVAMPRTALAIFTAHILGRSDESLIMFNVWIIFVLVFVGAYRTSVGLMQGEDSDRGQDTVRALQLYLPSKREQYWGYVLPLTTLNVWTTIMLVSAFAWPMQIFTELVYQYERPGLGMEVFHSGEYTYDAEAFIVSAFLLAIGSLLTWLIVWWLSRYYKAWFEA